jgi:DNA-binding response OmpR family regulator
VPNAAPIRTVIVDDEPLARLRVRMLLSDHADFAVVAECADGREALEAIDRTRPDLVFLDVQMAELDGVAVAEALERRAKEGGVGGGGAAPSVPSVVFVTAYDQHAVRAFALHAVDYLLKPFDEDRFVATLQRVRAQRAHAETAAAHARLLATLRELSQGALAPGAPNALGEPAPVSASALRVGDLDVDVRSRTVRRAGVPIALRPKEFELLVALLRRAGAVAPRRELLQQVWGYADDTVSRTLDTHVAELRRKLGRAPGEPGYIATVARAGYRLEP